MRTIAISLMRLLPTSSRPVIADLLRGLVYPIAFLLRQVVRGLMMFAAVGATVALCVRPSTWTHAVRQELARQLFKTAVTAVPFAIMVALGIGVFVVVQAQQWLDRLGHTSLLGPLLVMSVVRELGPLATNMLVIGRSGTSMTAEIGNMKMLGEIDLLDAQGVDPFVYLIVPRILGTGLAVTCLTLIVLVVSIGSGRLLALELTSDPSRLVTFADQILQSLELIDVFNFLAKTFLTGMLTGAICCVTGLQITGDTAGVATAAREAFVRCMAALLVVSAFVSLTIYI
ncbi:MAG: ABC transporter permease [Phycisphaeraceae bacterium]